MKYIESLHIELPQPGHPMAIKISGIIREHGVVEEIDLTAAMLVHYPIDIHIDGSGAVATLRMRVSELELNGVVVVKVEEPK